MIEVIEKFNLDCADVVDLFGEIAEENLSPSLRERVERHLCQCEYCRDLYHQYITVVEVAHELPVKEMSNEAQNRLRHRLNSALGLSIPFLR